MAHMGLLRIAYFCFLQLNYSIEDLSRFEKAGKFNAIEVDGLLSAFDQVRGTIADSTVLDDEMKASEIDGTDNRNFELLQVVLARCKTLFSTRKYRCKSAEERGNISVQPENNPVPTNGQKKVDYRRHDKKILQYLCKLQCGQETQLDS